MNLSASRWAPAGDERRNTPPAFLRSGQTYSPTIQESSNGTGNFDHDYDTEDMHLDSGDIDDYAFDTAIDDDGDVVMVDLNDPRIIEMVTELTRNERQAENMSDYADLKPGLRPAVSKSRIFQPSCLLIIDTNFIISHLQLVDNLVRSHSRWKNVVVMPWETIQELDGLKKSLNTQKGVDLGKLARNAINWAFGVFAKRDPGVWGQTKEECEDSHVRGDAAILECCRYFKSSHETILLSNDKNLCIQAMIHNIKTVSIVVGEITTAETILTRILGNSINLAEITETAFGSRRLSGPNLGYTPLSGYAPYNHENRQASLHDNIHQPTPPLMGPLQKVDGTYTDMNRRCFYQGIDRSQSSGIIRDVIPKTPIGNGLEASIYATTTTKPRSRYCTEPSNLSRRPLRTSDPPLRSSRNDESIAKVKKNLNGFLRRVSTELVITLIPLLKRCAQDKLIGPTTFTLEALNCNPEEQVRDVVELENFFHNYWASVFSEYLPADYGHAFKSGGLGGRWSGWIQWTETIGSNSAGPKAKEVKKWIDEWDFIWKRIIFTVEEIHLNIETADRWRTALLDVGLIA